MNTEQKILKLMSENKGKARVRTIAQYLRFGNSYVDYLCEQLLKKGLIKKLKSKGWYKITRKGKEEIGEQIKPSKKISKRKKTIKKLKKKNIKKSKKKVRKKRLKRKTKTPRKLRSRKKKVAKVTPRKIQKVTIKEEVIPSKKKSKKIIETISEVFKNLFFKKEK